MSNDNVVSMGRSKSYPIHREMVTRIIELIYEYQEDVNNIEIFGVLEAVKLGLHLETSLDFIESDDQ
jgi:hypothetical protein